MSEGTMEQRILAIKISNQIDAEIQKQKSKLASQLMNPKLLILGSGDSGKTTVLKQLKLIHGSGFSDKERLEFRQRIMKNVLDSMRTLIEALYDFELDLANRSSHLVHQQLVESKIEMKPDGTLPLDVLDAIQHLWKDEGIQKTFKRRNEFYLQDTIDYFFDELDRIKEPNYIPTDQDILSARHRTTQVTETKFDIDDMVYTFYDVGGQQSRRVYWAPYFENNVDVIVYVASLASYDQVLVEDHKTNRLKDSINLFDTIANHPLLQNCDIILFLNKVDLLKTKLNDSPVENYFPQYKPESEHTTESEKLRDVCFFFENLFLQRVKAAPEKKQIYTHFTTGTNTENMKVIIAAVR